MMVTSYVKPVKVDISHEYLLDKCQHVNLFVSILFYLFPLFIIDSFATII